MITKELKMKNKMLIIFSFCFVLNYNLYASESNGCVEEIIAETAELVLMKAKHLLLFAKMKELNKELDKTIDILNYKVISSLDEGLNLQEATSKMESSGNTITTLVNTGGINAKVRLVYLRAAILRFQFYSSKMMSKQIKDFNGVKK